MNAMKVHLYKRYYELNQSYEFQRRRWKTTKATEVYIFIEEDAIKPQAINDSSLDHDYIANRNNIKRD